MGGAQPGPPSITISARPALSFFQFSHDHIIVCTQIVLARSRQHQCNSVTVARSVGSALNCSPSVRLTDTRLASTPTIRSTAAIASSRLNADHTKNLLGEPPPGLTSTIQAALLWAVCAPGQCRAGAESLEKTRLLAMGPPLIGTGGSNSASLSR